MTSCRQPIGVSGVSTRIFVQRSRMTTTKVKISQRRRVGKVTRISLTSEIEERSLHYEPANYAGPPVGMTSFLVGCKNLRSAKEKRPRRDDHAKHGHDISCPYTRNRTLRSCWDSARRFAARFDFGEGWGAAFADGWVTGIFADVGGVVLAAVAYFAAGFLNGDGKRGDGVGYEIAVAGGEEIHLRDDEEAGQVGELRLEFCFELEVSAEEDFGFEARIDFLFVARSF